MLTSEERTKHALTLSAEGGNLQEGWTQKDSVQRIEAKNRLWWIEAGGEGGGKVQSGEVTLFVYIRSCRFQVNNNVHICSHQVESLLELRRPGLVGRRQGL